MKAFQRILAILGWALIAAVLVKFGWELLAGSRAGLPFDAATADAGKRMVIGPALGDRIFFYLGVLGIGLLFKARILSNLPQGR